MNSLQSTDEISRIWREVLSNNMDSFTVVVHEYRASVSAVAYSIIGDFAASQDIAQDTFLVAWIRRNELRDASRLGAWLCGISRNLARQARRRLKKSRDNGAATADSSLVSKEPEPQGAAAKREEEQLVWDALSQLPEKYRETVALYYREGESIAQVAAVTGVSAETARQRLSRGREMLRGRVAQLIGDVIGRTKPDAGFASRVIAAIVGVGAASKAAATASASTLGKGLAAGAAAGMAAKGLAGTGLAGGIGGGLLGTLGGVFGSWLGMWIPAQTAPSEAERVLLLERGRSMIRSALLFSIAIVAVVVAFIVFRIHLLWYVGAIMAISLVFCIRVVVFSLETQRLVRDLRKQLPPDSRLNQSPYGPLLKRWGAQGGSVRIQWASSWQLLGLPLIDVRFSGGSQQEFGVARGWIAIGDKAQGMLLAVGGVATGLVSFGGVAIGGIAVGGLSIGALALGGAAIGYMAVGGAAAGWHAAGGGAAGIHSAVGGCAIAGHVAHGGAAMARDFATGGGGSAKEFNTPAAHLAVDNESLKWMLDGAQENFSLIMVLIIGLSFLPAVLYRFVLPRLAERLEGLERSNGT
jgi:zinc protease